MGENGGFPPPILKERMRGPCGGAWLQLRVPKGCRLWWAAPGPRRLCCITSTQRSKWVLIQRSSGLAFSCCWLQKHGSLQQSSSRYGTCDKAAQPHRSPFKTLGSSLQLQVLFRVTSFGQPPPRTPPFSEQSHQACVISAFRNRHPARTRLAACLRTSCGFFVVVFKPYLKFKVQLYNLLWSLLPHRISYH